MKIRITALKYAESVLPLSWVFRGESKEKTANISFIIYLIETGSRVILADAGCETMPGFDMRNFCSPLLPLAECGYAPEDVTDVAVTHAHHDHIEAVRYFKNAIIHIQEEEWKAGKRYIPDDFRADCFERERVLDDGVRMLRIGGHSKGSCVVEIEAGDKTFVVAGDECYLRACLEKQIPTGRSCDPEKSEEFIRKYRDAKYEVLLCHDPEVLPGRNGVLRIL